MKSAKYPAVFAAALAAALMFTVSSTAHAQKEASEADLEAAKKAYAEGATAYGKNDFKSAVAAFKESYRLSKNPVLLYNIGSALESAGDSKLALFYYKKFLTDTPKAAANRDIAKKSALTLTRELAESEAATEPDPAEPDPAEPDPAEPIEPTVGPKAPQDPNAFQHNAIEEVPPGKPVDVTAFAPDNVGWKVYLNYRTPGSDGFSEIEMKKRYSELVARIPAAKVRGNTIQYYVEARDIGDEMVARSGKATSPHVILIEAQAKARFYPDFDGGDASDDTPPEFANGQGSARDGAPTDRMTYLKWGSTGAAIGFVALSATFLAIAIDASSSLEGVAVSSATQDMCAAGRPCQPYSASERDMQARGKRFETLGNVFLGLGVAAGIGAGVLWYLESKADATSDKAVTATPAVGPDFVGAAATVRF